MEKSEYMTALSKKDSDTIWVMKGFALLSIFYAHMSTGGGTVCF